MKKKNMKNNLKRICRFSVMIMLLCGTTGCSLDSVLETVGLEEEEPGPVYYLSEEEVPVGTYCIVHQETDKKNPDKTYLKYYPLYMAINNYSEDERNQQEGLEPSRIWWLSASTDEYLLPTMYPGDVLMYKSDSYIPTKFYAEKFFSEDYTIGIAGLTETLSGYYKFDSENGASTYAYSDAAGMEELSAESIYVVKADDIDINNENVSASGTVMGLEALKTYSCDIRTGTEKIKADLTANARYFDSAETYVFGDYVFITDYIIELALPDYMTTGYYSINDSGYFRYLKTESSYEKLDNDDYNTTIYAYDSETGALTGTTIGLVFDDNGFLVSEDGEESSVEYVPAYYNLSLKEEDDNNESTETVNTKDSNEMMDITVNELNGNDYFIYTNENINFEGTAVSININTEDTNNLDAYILVENGGSLDKNKIACDGTTKYTATYITDKYGKKDCIFIIELEKTE